MTDDLPTPEDKNEESSPPGRAMRDPEPSGVPPFDDFDLPEIPPFDATAGGETLIIEIDQPELAGVFGTDTISLEETPSPSPEPPPQEQVAGDTQPMRVRRTPSQGSAASYRPQDSSNPASQGVDARGVPLPRRVDEVDGDATRVTAVAYHHVRHTEKPPAVGSAPSTGPAQKAPAAGSSSPVLAQSISSQAKKPLPLPAPGQGSLPPPARPASGAYDIRRAIGCALRLGISGLFVLVVVLVCAGTFLIYQYYSIARDLPNVAELRQKASTFETTRILDRNGDLLYEILDPSAGRRTYVPLDKISPYLVAGTLATEDKEFYSHPGFDIFAIARAFLQNYSSGETVSGASTITQQLARNLLFTPEERARRTYDRKIREAVLAAEITRIYSKDEILELYLNENYYGNMAYGVEAAAQTYFGISADQLTLAQSAFLAGLPQAPAVYDVYSNRDRTFKRLEDVLVLMYEASQEAGCIYVSNSPQRVCLDPVTATQAANELKNYEFHTPYVEIRYPHWVNYVRSLLEKQYDPQTIYRSGFTVYTSLDPRLQDAAETMVKSQVDRLADQNATDGALVAIAPGTGEILAMVGSADFYNEDISGQVNMAVSPRQPGSSIKPLTYAAAFEKGWTPSTLIWDVPSEFTPSGRPDDPGPTYKPVNYDGKFHGPVLARTALGSSYNVPAVKALNYVGIYDDPATQQEDGFIPFARRMGITTLTRPDYGLSLSLGGGEVTLLELTGAYATLANNGRRIPPVAIKRIVDHTGNLVYEYQQPPGDQALRPEHASLITSILTDNAARSPAFGPDSLLRLPFPAAAKTGTTNDFRDNWTMGYTPDLAVGVWVGNADYTPMVDSSGVTGAAPIWNEFMQTAIQLIAGGNPTPFSRPGGVVEKVICAISGTEPSEWCPEQTSEIFAADQPPLPKEDDLWQKLRIDTWTGLKASAACPDFTDEAFTLNVRDEWGRKWIKTDKAGKNWAEELGFDDPVRFSPTRECTADDPRPLLAFTAPSEGMTVSASPLDLFGLADATSGFKRVRIEFGRGEKPVEWELLVKGNDRLPAVEKLYTWDLLNIEAGLVTVRMVMESTEDTYAETFLHLNIQVPTPTPTPTETPTPTYTPTPTLVPTWTPTITPTETPHLPKATPVPTDTVPPSDG